ncbi:MAG: FG-GAP-like repeat-containing protein [Candidatus Kapaibacterium sp.]
MIQRSVLPLLCLLALDVLFAMPSSARVDTVKKDNGVATTSSPLKEGWEESVILTVGQPCRLKKVQIYYASGTGTDQVKVTGDASEGTIPPSQYCFSYNTLAEATATVSGKGWVEIDMSRHNVTFDGYDRIVIQHVVTANGPNWGQDNNGQSPSTSFQYDPVTPNPNFFNIAGIYYLARGDYMVRLVVELPFDVRPAATMLDVTSQMGLTGTDGKPIRSDQVSVVDWNGDGFDDVCIPGQFFQNDSGRGFRRVQLPFAGGPTSWGDVDNDGDIDVLVMQGFGNDQLWRNDGGGTFTNVSAESKIVNSAPGVTALWLDIEQDGDLDLFIANGRSESNGNEVYFQDKLWRNDGKMVFTDVTAASKLSLGEPAPFHDTWGASLCDFNNDGRTDIFVATYRLAPDRLYRNNGDGTFTEVSSATGAIGVPTTQPQYFGHGMGSEWGDVNGDGLVDLFVGNLGHPDSRAQYSNPSLVLRNSATAANPRFINWYEMSADGVLDWHGIKFKEMNAGMCLADLNHDGALDVWHGQISYDAFGNGANRPAHLYLGSPDPIVPFRDVTWESGMFIHGAWTSVRGDFDRDGDLDLICASGTENLKYFRNDLAKEGSSITIRLRDVRSGNNRNAYGARLTVYAGGSRLHRWMPGTVNGGRMSQMTHDLHVGIGSAQNIDSVVVTWPGNSITRHTGLTPHSYVELTSDGKQSLLAQLRPVNLRPASGSSGVKKTDEFAWSAPSGTTVTLEITPRSGTNTQPILRTNIASSRMAIDLPDGLYSWRIVSAKGASDSWTVHIGNPVPSVPTILSPVQGSTVPTTTTLRWTRSSYAVAGSFVTQYRVRIQNTISKVPLIILDTMTTDSSLKILDLPAASTLSASIKALFRAEDTADSASVSFLTYGVPMAPDAIFPTNGAANVTTRLKFQWSRPAYVDKGFEIEVDTLEGFTTSTIRKASDTSLTWTPPLKGGRLYYWRSRGNNLAGNGTWSSTASFTTTATTSVYDEPATEPCTGRVDIYDLRGQLLAVASSDGVEQHLSQLSGVLLVVSRRADGSVCRTDVRVK